MKKTLFSIAFLAASGSYVAFANHAFDAPPSTQQTSGAPAVPPASVELAMPVPKVSSPPPLLDAPTLATSAPSSTTALSVASKPAAAAALAPAQQQMPPLPRPRPVVVPAPTIEPAQATAVAASSAGQYLDGTYAGTSENAYYGRVLVQVTVAGHRIASIKVLDYPQDRRTSRYINSQALPLLQQEVMQAQSDNVDTISGATLTSEAYIRSLGRALNKAAGNNA
jgi:uncharacterized protein with FMN-binding domain